MTKHDVGVIVIGALMFCLHITSIVSIIVSLAVITFKLLHIPTMRNGDIAIWFLIAVVSTILSIILSKIIWRSKPW